MTDKSARERLAEGQRVLFRPTNIGYGYQYCIDGGIPATVVKRTPSGLVTIRFHTKGDPDDIRIAHVAEKNLELVC